MKRGIWRHGVVPNYSENTVGIIGLGAIGRESAMILKSLRFSVVAWTLHPERHTDFIKDNKIRMLRSVDEVCSLAHIVSLHLRLSKQTENIVGLKQLKAMKANGCYLINCSRAGLLDYKGLKIALEKNWVSGSALDVWPEEAIRSKWLKELAANHRVIATPHIAGGTPSAISKSIALRAYNIAWHLHGFPGIATVVPLEELE